jgi:ABC-type phosphate/phosphonate transport system substrate-binding protein
VDKIKKALLALNIETPEHMAILKKARFIAVIPARDEDFNSVRRLAQIVESGGKP